ncbi:hypothetical protein [Clostridium estertheticum]|uniref:Uncharacterized protein n=1 Tax=Clostridium estertheticum TaxID=238834 RepID=A0A7Y3SW71_9CLOT|nr:hypothetical protein [Clostridium estertheticum]NNU76277.1 hypothetical protein [Clostridium estertheticum]WBL46153.1 hypothetical protein LOR37_15910 [Clostridium estertheticum]
MIFDIVFKYLNDGKVKTTSGGWGSTGSILDKEGYKSFGNSGGSASGFNKNEDVINTIK